jgi:hypothetical protein
LQKVLNRRKGTSRGSPWTMEKRKKKSDIGKGLEQIRKLGEDVKP